MLDVAAVDRLVMGMPEVTRGTWHGNRTWVVGRTAFAWVRPFSKADVRRFGAAPVPAGPILAVRVADLATKDAVLAAGTRGVFTIPHFDGYAAVLLQLDVVARNVVQRRLEDAWLACAPPASLALGRVRDRPRHAVTRAAAARDTRRSGRGTGR